MDLNEISSALALVEASLRPLLAEKARLERLYLAVIEEETLEMERSEKIAMDSE